MNRRSRGREIALQVLYLIEQNPEIDPVEIDRFIARRVREPWLRGLVERALLRDRPDVPPKTISEMLDRRLRSIEQGIRAGEDRSAGEGELAELARAIEQREFVKGLFAGVRKNRPRIDKIIGRVAENWRLDRMAAIDRNIIRLGVYEILFSSNEVPRKVAINEALELAKRYSTAQSSRFVNGILDRLPASLADVPSDDEAETETKTAESASLDPARRDELDRGSDRSIDS
jgi:N utilization substance protein B